MNPKQTPYFKGKNTTIISQQIDGRMLASHVLYVLARYLQWPSSASNIHVSPALSLQSFLLLLASLQSSLLLFSLFNFLFFLCSFSSSLFSSLILFCFFGGFGALGLGLPLLFFCFPLSFYVD